MKQHTPAYLATLRVHENGSICCDSPIVANRCPKCQAFHAAEKRTPRAASLRTAIPYDATPPDPYARDISARREAAATPESRFAEQYRADQMRAIDEQHAEWSAKWAAERKPRLTAAEASRYTPPNPYSALDKMRSENR